MGCGQHTGRCFLLTVCVLQIISTAERQVFDFLGYMWLPIIANFFNFILVIFGFFGAYQYKTKYIVIYLVWELAWLSWNVFVICFYLNVGVLENSRDWLNFGTGSASWWEVNGIGCRAVYPTNLTTLDPMRPMRPLEVHDCLVDYEYVETIHAGIQCGFAILGLCASTYLIKVFSEEDDSCKAKSRPTSIYSVEYSPQREGSESPELGLDDSSYQQPMTPRRVKRQSRHRASGRSQTRSNTSSQGRASQRSRRHQYLNPVNRLMDKANESSTSTDSYHPPGAPRTHTGGRQGHSNPMYVHSRPNSTYSINSPMPGQDPLERPPSVHSSYSNYHGQRPSLNPNPYGRPPVQQPITASLIGGSQQRRVQGQTNGHVTHGGTLGSLRSSTYSSGGTMKVDRERPPPYMFGVNSETVI
ncbi:sodium/potassium-transporting ATPase subunit beta-1-interacting protein-like isoform X2 [Eriocheir sinensis]|uniref:sodium/potassium-transporting ATPase subunit beta-1-interacting protein-like isoform X2 n=1 Tax=Eriocheir sinensis TaxID=95602 RepID=UPI0021C81FF6|nr:sodium/potassium-transporting ATPase subunit beta-1-interacting protein-like isoform X2 [Eriocheir sinensis]